MFAFFVTIMVFMAPGIADRVDDFSLLQMLAEGVFSIQGGMFGMMLILIYAITVGNKLVVKQIDQGTMSFILNTPTTRKQIIFSKTLFYISSILLMIIVVGLFVTVSSVLVDIELNLARLWLVLLGFFLYALAVSGICFAASCWFNKAGYSIMLGAGLPIIFFLFSSLSIMEDLNWMRFLSINTLFDAIGVVNGATFIPQFIALFAIGVACYIVGIIKFLKKDLPL